MSDDDIIDAVRDAGLDWHAGFPVGDGENRYAVLCRAVARAARAAERAHWKARVEQAFIEGFRAPQTYNDSPLNTADEAWEAAKAGLLREPLAAREGR